MDPKQEAAGMAMTPEKDSPPRETSVVLAELQLVERTLATTEEIARAHGLVENRSYRLRQELWEAIQRDARR